MAVEFDTEIGRNGREHEVSQPLISGIDSQCGDGKSKGSIAVPLLVTGVAVLGSFQLGACDGYSSPIESEIREELGLSTAEFSIFGSILSIGAMVGAITCGSITDYLGRKGGMRMSCIMCLIGWLAIIFSQGTLLLYFGRFSAGFGIGILSYVVPVFIAEIAPVEHRGRFTSANTIVVPFGLTTVYIVGTFVSWRTLTFVGMVPCILLFIGLVFVPESPRWLAKMGYQQEFQSALQRLRGKDTDISQELTEIREYNERLQCLPMATCKQLFERKYKRIMIIVVGLMFLRQFAGINALIFYGSETFVEAGFASEDVGNIVLGVIRLPVCITSACLTDKIGRRSLMMVSAYGAFLSAFVAAVSYYLKGQRLFLEWDATVILFSITFYVGSLSMGMGGIPWVVTTEILPIEIKAVGGGLVTLSNWFGSWLVSYAFNFVIDWSASGTFFIFSAVCLLTVVFVAKMVPETKGRSLEEIHSSLTS